MIDLAPLTGKRVFLSGSTGLIGSNIMEALDGICSISDPLKAPVTREDADFIIHAAGYAQPSKFLADPLATIKVNTEGTMQLLGRLKPGGKFLYLSSSEIYSGSWRPTHGENDTGHSSPWDWRAPYIEGKRCGEAICAAHYRQGVDVSVARVSLAYGPGTKPGDTRVMSQFIHQALTEGRITLKDQGLALRTYGYISDIVEMLLNVLLYAPKEIYNGVDMMSQGVGTPVYNVGGISITSIRALAEMIADITGAKLSIPPHSGSGMVGAPAHVSVDLGRYLRHFGNRQFVDLRDGVKRTIAYHEQMLKAEKAA